MDGLGSRAPRNEQPIKSDRSDMIISGGHEGSPTPRDLGTLTLSANQSAQKSADGASR